MYIPKVFANVFTRVHRNGDPDNSLTFVLEYTFMDDPPRSGKCEVQVTPIHREDRLTSDLKEALAAFLTTKYSTSFTDRDVVGLGV